MKHIVIVYDIRDDKRRTKIFKTLKDYATPVQYSVFEAIITKEEYVNLKYRLKRLMKKEDSIIFYSQCASCKSDLERLGTNVVVFGDIDLVY
ncbi:CRISPR-associated endonuclease Cas2 [Desulfuribacillus stibiiarsenatis]|uniref:CRISPR-associated endoribonuclease Cas2 n=1 Tax=Desulfuribacillus stibiiarsenatis TaxID=1390249 RepID=A0A1E5L4R4_9FIRM|nr:CRISPR-associated endonuclease Cas2 [Desulfuribacillus stibiiarsenatis]OEH85137.1 CRISPR-associated endonuclease Cas2 [Desulfuribacillus stibiiarsenatis]